MTALAEVSAYLPQARVPVADLGRALGLSDSQIEVLHRRHGLREVRRQRPGESHVDLLAAAVSQLDSLDGVRYVLYARGVNTTTPYPVSPVHELCRRLGLTGVVAFTVSHHGCATSLLAIDLAGRLLTGDPGARVLIVTGEQVFTLDPKLPPESRIFGEAAGACLVSATGPRDRLLSYATRQRGDLDLWAPDPTDIAERFAHDYRYLLSDTIRAAAGRAGLGLDEISLILPHNVNVVSWKKVCQLLDFPVERVLLDNVPRLGHTFAADAFINLCTARELLRPGDRYLIAAAGFGATFAAMIFEH
jgi:3-oxoacyl-[acyl-carrier-protein] synthase III